MSLSHTISNKLEKKTIFLEHRNDFYSSQGYPDSSTEMRISAQEIMASCSLSKNFHGATCCCFYPPQHKTIQRFSYTETLSSTMGHGLGLGKAVDSADDRAMIKPKPSLPANSQNQGDSNTLDYLGFWQQKAVLHFTNSAYKGAF